MYKRQAIEKLAKGKVTVDEGIGEVWIDGAKVAGGPVEDLGFNQLKLSYDPATQRLTVSVNGAPGGSYAVALGAPRYAAFEGLGTVDNFVVRSAGAGTP